MRRTALLLAVGAATALQLAWGAVVAIPAHAWTVTQPWQGVIEVQRSADDTGPMNFTVYTKAGAIPDSYYTLGTYDSTASGGFFNGTGVTSRAVSVDASSQGFQYPTTMNALVADSGGWKQVCALTSGMPVYWTAAQPVYTSQRYSVEATAATVSIPGTVAVSNTASISVEGTLPVDAFTIAGVSPEFVGGAVWLGIACLSFGVTLAVGGRFYRE